MNVFLLFLFAAPLVPRMLAQSNFPQLLAKGPEAKYQEKLQLFGQFVGSWTFEGKQYKDDGSQTTDKGEIHFHWVLQGRAVQDVWLETENSEKSALLYGTTIRFYNPKTDTWSSTWIEPRAGVVRVFVGRKAGSEIVLEGKTEGGTPIRWIFSEIGATSFHWRGERNTGSGWHIYEELNARRVRGDGQ